MPVIRSGRCDDCRRRKRRCDELRPSCSSCSGRHVTCVYSREIPKFVHLHQSSQEESSEGQTSANDITRILTTASGPQITLTMRSTKQTPDGNGTYHKFVPDRSTSGSNKREIKEVDSRSMSISPMPTNATSRLQAEFAGILHCSASTGYNMHTWGQWLDLSVSRIGTSELLDRSVTCLLLGHKTRLAYDAQVKRESRHSYVVALKILRKAVTEETPVIDASLIAATKMLMAYEIAMGSEQQSWMPHAHGAINLFLAAGPNILEHELGAALFYSVSHHAWEQGSLAGLPSAFDKPAWLERIPTPPDPRIDREEVRCHYHLFTRIPRLICLVRALKGNPCSYDLAKRALSLGRELLDLCGHADNPWVTKGKLIPTLQPEDANVVPLSFDCQEADYHLIHYLAYTWSAKIMLSGLLQSLISLGIPFNEPSLEDLQEAERRYAMLLCMTVDFAESLAPYGCLPFLLPIEIAWGTYYRQQDLALGIDCEGMMDWLMRRGNVFLSYAVPVQMRYKGLAFFTERLMGGPLVSE